MIQCSALCSFSCPRLHQECVPPPWASDIPRGGVSLEGVLAAQWSVRATSGCFWVISVSPILARTHPYTPAVPREAWGWRVSFHRVRTLWGSLVRVCPTIQRLPVCLPDCPGDTSEFLRLPFRLRKCTAEPYQFLSTDILTPVLALWDPCNVVMAKGLCHQGGIQHYQQGQNYWMADGEHIWRSRTGTNSRASCSGASRGSERAGLCLSPITALGPGRLRRGWVAALSLCFFPHWPLFTLPALCDNCPLNWAGREDLSAAIYNRQFVLVNRLVHMWLWSYFYPDSTCAKVSNPLCFVSLYVLYTAEDLWIKCFCI